MRTTFLILSTFMILKSTAQVQFQNVSTIGGLNYQGRTYGSSWGDINGDGLMDLYLSCHQNSAEPFFTNDSIRIFLNLGGGLFDGTIYSLDDGGQSDFHGGVFFDYDNDGDKDMLLVNGGTKKNVFLRNDGGTDLVDHADEENLALNKSRGRQSTCLDVNNDGVTDLVINNDQPSNPIGVGTSLMLADPGSAYSASSTSGLSTPYSVSSSISDLNGDNRADLIVASFDSLTIFSIGLDGIMTQVDHLYIPNITDINIADFNGDLLPDIFVARGLTEATDIQQFNDSVIQASCRISSNENPCEGTFTTDGSIVVSILTTTNVPFNVHIGNDSTANNITSDPGSAFHWITLSPDSYYVHGFQLPLTNTDPGINCSFGLLPNGVWKFKLAATTSGTTIIMQIKSSSSITNFSTSSNPQPGEESRDLLLINQGNYQFVESTDSAFMLDEYSISVTSGDFDNDMDNDLIVMATGRAANRKDHVYENNGNGTFTVHENGWGTKGDVAGVGDAVTSGDFNNDGFLDLLVTNGSTSFFLDSAGIDLYQNMGNTNHWITLDLNGTVSNADGFGARIVVEANGVSQVGNMTGGIHTASQDDDRVHFGLGNATDVSEITVYWPSGIVDVLHDQDVDQILSIEEGEYAPTGINDHAPTTMDMPDAGSIDHIIIYNALGQPVESTPFSQRNILTQQSQLPAGLYLITYLNRTNQVLMTKKFIIE